MLLMRSKIFLRLVSIDLALIACLHCSTVSFNMSTSKVVRKLLLTENIHLKLDYCEETLWVHELNQERTTKGEYHTLFSQLRQHPDKFFEYCRMSIETFDLILNRVEHRLQKTELNYRKVILPEERLVVTLR